MSYACPWRRLWFLIFPLLSSVGLISKYSWTRMMFAASGFCWVCKVCSSFLPPSLVSSLSSFSLGLAATKSGSLSTQHYLFSFLLARVFSRDKGEGRRGRTGLIPGRSRSLGQPSPPAPNQPQDNQPIFVPSFFFFFFPFSFLSSENLDTEQFNLAKVI